MTNGLIRYVLLLVLPVCNLLCLKAFAQGGDSALKTYTGRYIQPMKNYLSLKLSVNNNTEGFVDKTSAVKFDLRPNDKLVTRLALNYRFLSFAVAATPAFLPQNRDNNLKGKSRFASFSLNLNFNRWLQSFAYSRSQGYYLYNTGDFRTNWQQDVDSYIQFPNLVYKSFHGQTAYKFNQRYSFNALNTQTERQLKSAGTFMPLVTYRYYIVDDRTMLTGQGQTQKSNNFEALLSISYYYTFVIRQKWYASIGAAPGVGMIFSKLQTRALTEQMVTHYNNPVYTLGATASLGYNAERFFAGIQLSAASTVYSRRNVVNVIENDRAAYQFFLGYRLRAPAFLKRMLDRAEQKEAELLETINRK